MNLNTVVPQNVNNEAKPSLTKEKLMSYEEKSVGSTSFFKCEACPYMALAEDDIKFHLFTVHPDLAKTNGLADNIRIPCPGCSSAFDAEETLRNHLRNHHKMGIKDVKKMIKSLVQIALKDAKLKKEEKKEEPPSSEPSRQDMSSIKMPQVIEIIPDVVNANDSLPKGVTFISVDELQKMSTPNFEKVDPKEIIQEASINIVYTNDLSTQYVNTSSHNASRNLIQMSSVTPDLISSIQPCLPSIIDSGNHLSSPTKETEITHPIAQKPKPGRPKGSRSIGSYKDDGNIKEVDVEEKLGKLCSVDNCHVRLKDEEKLSYHRRCHRDGRLVCLECNKVFESIASLHTHLWKEHSLDMQLPTCEICGYKTYKKHRLYNIHMKCHSKLKTYVCSICSKVFKTSGQLTKHRMIHNKDTQEKISCSICGLEFNKQARLKAHVAQVHEKIRPFKCSHCQYTAARKSELSVHVRCHTGDKPYSCDKCNYRSSDHNSMRRHKRLHTKENVYKCKHCPYSTIQSTVFASHMISKHPNLSSNDLHRCPYCSFKTVNKDKYVVHLTTHPDKEGIQLLIEMNKNAAKTPKPSWNIPSSNTMSNNTDALPPINENSDDTNANKQIQIEVFDCDSQQDNEPQKYPKNYSTHPANDIQSKVYNNQEVVTDLSKDDNNSDCILSESSNDIMLDRHQYAPQHHMQNIPYDTTPMNLHFQNNSVPIDQTMLPNSGVNSLTSSHSPIDTGISNNIMNNFPIRLPTVPQLSARNNINLKPVDKISMTKVIGPIIKPSQILPVPSSSNSPVNMMPEPDGMPRKKPKISVKSNLILKGPDQGNMFHSQQKMAFKQLEDNERYGLGPVTFNNLITTQFMQLPPEPTLSESPNNMMPYPQENLLGDSSTPPVDNSINNTSQIFSFNQQMNVNSMTMLPPQPKIQTSDPSYIKLEGTIKQNNQSPSLERMCNANAMLNSQAISREYKASPPLEDIHKNMNEIKNEVKSDYYNMPLNNSVPNAAVMDQYLIDNIIGEQYAAHMDLATLVLPIITEEQQNDVIEIDDNSDDNKMLPRFDVNFPLESLYLMHNDFHLFDNDVPMNNLNTDLPNDMNRMVTEVPIVNQKEVMNLEPSEAPNDFPNFIQGKKDPMMNTSVRLSTNKINVKNIELMKN